MKMKKVFSAVMAVVMSASLAACGSTTAATTASTQASSAAASTVAASTEAAVSTTATTTATDDSAAAAQAKTDATAADKDAYVKIEKAIDRPDGGYKFGYTCMDGTNPYFVYLHDELEKQIEANGDTLITTDPANDVTKQISQVEDMISQGIQVCFMNPVDAEGIAPALDELKSAGVYVIGFDTQVGDMTYETSYAGSDNYNAGFVDGQDLLKQCPDGGKIIILDSPTMQSITDRTDGFKDAIKDKIDDGTYTIAAEQDAQGNLEKSEGICEDLLQANSDAVAIFGGNDPTALGALAAANAAGMKNVLIYGVDGSPDVKAEIAKNKDGGEGSLIRGSGAQSPKTIADTSAQLCYDFLSGKPIKTYIPVKTFLITADNVDDYGTDSWQ